MILSDAGLSTIDKPSFCRRCEAEYLKEYPDPPLVQQQINVKSETIAGLLKTLWIAKMIGQMRSMRKFRA
jgi:hypothetical protein